jgi:hypothetical protein
MSLIDSFVEVTFEHDDDFLLIKETLTRIGIAAKNENKLFQTCHILHKGGRYFIVHFKEMFLLDGKESTYTEQDLKRRNTIASLLQDWELLTVVNPEKIVDKLSLKTIKIVPFKDKKDWELIQKYSLG